jgi:hypothetical protein
MEESMKTIRRFWRQGALITIGLLLTVGCIVSGQFVIVISPDANIHSTDEILDWLCIDIADYDDDWDDHKDDIQSIQDIKFEAKIINHLGTSITGQVYILDAELPGTPSAQDVIDNGVLFLSEIIVDGNSEREITFSESADFISNLDEVLTLIEDGLFCIYGIAESAPFDFTITGIDEDGSRIMITFSAG